jgi:hypothetical protein
MKAQVVTVAHPFLACSGVERRTLRRRARVRSLAPAGGPVIAILNGRPLLRAGWRRRLRDGDHLAFVRLPAGGGAGGNSDPLRALLSIALIAVAGPAGSWIGGLLGGGKFVTALAQATILIGGQYLINALIPPPKPDQPGRAFTLQPQGNLARLEQAIPVHYGRLRFFPDFAAEPYVENSGNVQYLFQLHCLGAGEFDVEAITIGDTPLSSFGEVETEIVPPGGQVTLFPTAVESSDVVSGQELRGRVRADWSRAGGLVTIEEEDHNRASGQVVWLLFDTGSNRPPDGVYVIGTVPNENTWTVTASGSGTGSGKVEVRSVIGGQAGFPACEPGQTAAQIGVDLILPRGLHGLSGTKKTQKSLTVTFEARRIADDDTPLSDWTVLGTEELRDKTSTPILHSKIWSVTPGRYAVRAWREDRRANNDAAAHDAQWAGLRGYLTAPQNWPPVTLLALRLRATGNLSLQASRRIAVTATRKLPIWDGNAWTAPQPTRSIAWALADLARNADYGPGLGDWQIDTAALAALDAIWTERGDRFDHRFEAEGTWWEAATVAARAGRARVFLQGGVLRVVRDGPETVPVALYSMRNILRGTFRREWVMPSPDTAQAVEVVYLDAQTWRQERVRAAYPGATGRHATIRLDGVTQRAQALREAWYYAASNRHRRTFLSFETEAEGFIPSLGDLIAVQHDVIGAGEAVEVCAWDAGTRTLRVTAPLDWSGGGPRCVMLARPDGSVAGPWTVTRGAGDDEIVLPEIPDFTPETAGQHRERTRGTFGHAETVSVLAKVIRVEPSDEWRVRLAAVVEDPAVHVAEAGQVAAPRVVGALPRAAVAPVVSNLRATVGGDGLAWVSWRAAQGATQYHVEVAEGGVTVDPEEGWVRSAEVSSTQVTLRLPWGPRSRVRVRALGLAAGPWATVQVGVARPIVWQTVLDGSLVILWDRRATGTAWDLLTDTIWNRLTEELDA